MKTLIIISGILAISLSLVLASSHRDEYKNKYEIKSDSHKEKYKDEYRSSKNKNQATKQSQLYIDECGSCHMPYQAEFLPKRSWNKIMNNLENHFKVDATVEKIDEIKLREYLEVNASDSKRVYGEMENFSSSISQKSTPIAISELPKFKKEHEEVPLRLITQKEVKGIANCNACHKDALDGLYKERNIFIPNHGRWDD